MAEREIPKITLSELRKTDSDSAEVMDCLIKMFHARLIKDPLAIEMGVQQAGLEGSLEGFEELIDKGYLKITHNERTEMFGLIVWDVSEKEYVSIP